MAKRLSRVWLFLFLSLALVAGACALPAFAAQNGISSEPLAAGSNAAAGSGRAELSAQSVTATIEDGIYYIPDSSGKGWLVAGCSGKLTSVSIPWQVKLKRVTGIAPNAFKGNTSITMVTLKDDIANYASFKTVASSAFEGCTNLAMVYLPDSVESIGDNAFKGCSKLGAMNQLGYEWNNEYANVICDYTFRDDASKLKTIGASAFEGCAFETIYLPASVRTVGASAFKNCAQLDCVASKSSGITSIGEGAFLGCTALRGITMPQTVTGISAHLFEGCTKLSDVYLSADTTKIEDYAFYGCKNLLEFGFSGYADVYAYSTKWTGSTGLKHYPNHNYTEGIENVTTIGNSAFRGCSKLQKFNFCDGLKAIGSYAFAECPALESVELPDGLTSLGESAFNNDEGLATFSFPRGTGFTTIPQSALNGCPGVQFLTIPANVSHVGLNAFKGMTGLTAAYFQGTNFATDNSSSGETPFTGCDNTKLTLYGHTDTGNFKNFGATCVSYGHAKEYKDLSEAGQVTITFKGWNYETLTITAPAGSVATVPEYNYDDGTWRFLNWHRAFDGEYYEPGDLIRLGSANEELTGVFTKYDLAVTPDTATITLSDPKANDGAGDTRTIVQNVGATYTLPNCTTKGVNENPTTGYAFKSWLVKMGSSETAHQPGDKITLEQDATITAQYGTTYKITLSLVDSSTTKLPSGWATEMYTNLQGTIDKLPEPLKTSDLENKTKFNGWRYTGSYGVTGVVVTEEDAAALGKAATIFTGSSISKTINDSWVAAMPPVITFDASPGTVEGTATITQTTDSSRMLPSMSSIVPDHLEGYTFKGWARLSSSGFLENVNSSTLFSKDTTLYASWAPILVDTITLNETSAKLEYGKTLQLQVTATPEDALDKSVTWTTSDKNVATVSSSGLVKAVGVGKATITATAVDGSGKDATCTITATAPISSAAVTVAAKTYTGKALKPAPTVKFGSKTLKAGTDYTVSYAANTNVGKASVTITGKGSYTGTKKATFSINPKGTSLKKLKPGKKVITVKWKKQAKQTDGYQIRYSLKKNMKKAKTVTVKGAKKTSKKIKKLKSKKKYYVQIRTYKKVGGKTYYSAWSKAKFAKAR